MNHNTEDFVEDSKKGLVSNPKKIFMLLGLGTLSVAMGQSLVFAILPPLGREIGLTEIQIGSIITFSAAVFFISSPRWGRKSDYWGRKRVILIGLMGYTIGTIAFASVILLGMKALISSLAAYLLLVLVRMGQSVLMSATPPGATAYIADITEARDRVSGMGIQGASNNVGTILGPGIGGALAAFGLLMPLYFAAFVTFASGIVIWYTLPRSPHIDTARIGFRKLRYLDSRYFAFFLVGFVMFMSFSVVMQTAAFYFQDMLGLDGETTARYVGIGMMVSAALSLFSQGVLVQLLKWSPFRLLSVGVPIILLSFLGLIFSGNLQQLIGSMAILGLGTGMATPGIFAGASLMVSAEEQGSLAGLMSSCPPLGFIVGPLIGTGFYTLGPTYPYILVSGLYVPLIIFTWRLKKNTNRQLMAQQ